MLEIEWGAGKGAQTIDGKATREGGYIHCPKCEYPGLYWESMICGGVCVECGTEYENEDVLKPIVTVKK